MAMSVFQELGIPETRFLFRTGKLLIIQNHQVIMIIMALSSLGCFEC